MGRNASPHSSPRSWKIPAVLLVVGSALLGLVALRPIWDVDIFWHIAAGRWMLEHGAFPATDIFSFRRPVWDWVTFQWLYEVLCALVDRAGGLTGIRWFHAGLTALAFASFAGFALASTRPLAEKLGAKLWLAVSALLVTLLFALYADRVRARPHVMNVIGWSLLLHLLLNVPQGRWIRRIGGPATVLVWANFHAGGAFIFLVAALALPLSATLDRLVVKGEDSRWFSTQGRLLESWLEWGTYLLVCLLSPNWLGGVVQAYTMLGGSEMLIDEWLPFWHYFVVAMHPLHILSALAPLVALVVVGWLLFSPGRKRLESSLLVLGLLFLPYRSARFVLFEAFVAVLVLPPLIERLAGFLRTRGRAFGAATLLSALLLAGATFDFHTRAQFGSIQGYVAALGRDLDERRYPVELAEPIEALAGRQSDGEPLRIFCLPNWGGYLLYRHFPRVRVVADGRGNFPRALGERLQLIYYYRHDLQMAPLVEETYTESGADVVVMQRPAFAPGYSPAGWLRFHASAKGEVWVREGTF